MSQDIDESIVKDVGEYVPFLDIQFCFNKDGDLQTDLYIKPTDARSYLNYTSAHPKHTFSRIVYSQCLRLRRIINHQDRLKLRLDELCLAFEKSGYPKSMLQNISAKVLNTPRQLRSTETNNDAETTDVTNENDTTHNQQSGESNNSDESEPILVVSNFGTDDKLIKSIKNFENDFLKTNTFKNTKKTFFKFVKKTGANIGCRLSVLKSLALGHKFGTTSPCFGHGNCKCCLMIDEPNLDEVNGIAVSTVPGNCKSKNVIYLVTCRLCQKSYIGRTVQPLSDRLSGHRACFYKVLRNHNDVDINSDDFSLGLHIANDHDCVDQADFNRLYRVQILENCSPSTLEKKEHCFIHKYNTLFPLGLNKTNPFGLTILR